MWQAPDALQQRACQRHAQRCADLSRSIEGAGGDPSPLGVQLLSALCDAGWLRRSWDSRAVVLVTPKGWAQFKAQLGLAPRDMENLEQKPALAG